MNLNNYYQYENADEKAKLLIERILGICEQEQLTFSETRDLLYRLYSIAGQSQKNYLEKMTLEVF